LLYYEENKKEGILHGMVKEYFNNGQLHFCEEYKEGLKMECLICIMEIKEE
jgi:antitoxin component YwqK of YwqJK toxin-antitoxin module